MFSNPKYTFYLGIAVTIFLAISNGTVHLTHMIPDWWIPYVTAWVSFLAFVGSTVMTTMAGMNSTKASVITTAANLTEVKEIKLDSTKPETMALNQATPNNVNATPSNAKT